MTNLSSTGKLALRLHPKLTLKLKLKLWTTLVLLRPVNANANADVKFEPCAAFAGPVF